MHQCAENTNYKRLKSVYTWCDWLDRARSIDQTSEDRIKLAEDALRKINVC